ncbi:MAG: SH3 domain-containing protein, partial [Chloroflexota bacterium]
MRLSFWKSRTGKLVIGGCGAQVGLLVTLGGLLLALLLCSVCVSLNVLAFGLRQTLASPVRPTVAAASGATSSNDVQSLVQDIDVLMTEIEFLQAHAPVAASRIEPAPAAKPSVTANHNGVTLHQGPGADFPQAGVLPVGQAVDIIGRNPDSSWWLLAMPDGSFAWVARPQVTASNINDSIPVVMTPSQLGQAAASVQLPAATPSPTPTPTPLLPPGTPTPTADQERQYVEDLPAYRRVKAALLVPPVSASISPDGSLIAMTERINLYTVTTAGANTDIWLADNNESGPLGGAVWSPDGQYLAFVVGFKNPKCRPCRSVALLRLADGLITYLEAPDNQETDMPRWTQEGRLLINVHAGEPADGLAYIYDISGHSQPASGVYVLSSSHEGQKWYPWLPGRI